MTTTPSLQVLTFDTRAQLGQSAAEQVANRLRQRLAEQPTVAMIFAAAPSQEEFLAALIQQDGIDWNRVIGFHMDEYVGLSEEAPQRFGNFLKSRLFDRVPFRAVHYLNGNAPDVAAECQRYADLLQTFPTDIVCMGIGENGHIAFNDPHVADFRDPLPVKQVDLDQACRQQQVNDGCFDRLDAVPTHALTLTIPVLMTAPDVFCMVPGPAKAQAVFNTLHAPLDERHPSTILRQHSNARLFIDRHSAALL